MKSKLLLTLILVTLTFSTQVFADQTNKLNKADQANQTNTKEVMLNEEKVVLLAKEKKCLACHTYNRKSVGPSFFDIKQMYEKDLNAVEKLSIKIIKGGSGSWGAIPMPPNPNVSENEAKILAKWILAK